MLLEHLAMPGDEVQSEQARQSNISPRPISIIIITGWDSAMNGQRDD